MVNEWHLEILKQGVEVWNIWREDHPKLRPDLRDSSLSNVILSKANLRSVDLSRAILFKAKS